MNLLFFAPPLFFFIVLIFPMLGMGGSQIYIPILFWLGMDFKTEAIPLGMLLNVVNSASAASTYARERLIDWKTAIPFAVCIRTYSSASFVMIMMNRTPFEATVRREPYRLDEPVLLEQHP